MIPLVSMDWNRLVQLYLPSFFRNREKWQAWAAVVAYPFALMYEEMLAYRAQLRRENLGNGQTIVLQSILRDLYAGGAATIKVSTNAQGFEEIYAYQRVELTGEPVYVYKWEEMNPADPGDPLRVHVYKWSEQNDENVRPPDFFVRIAPSLYDTLGAVQLRRIEATTRKFKAYGTTFQIIRSL